MTITTELAQRMRKLSAEIVENLVDTDGADEEYVDQYLKWTQEILTAFVLDALAAKDEQIAELTAGWGNCQKTMGVYCHAYEEAKAHITKLIHNHRVHAARLIDERGMFRQRIAELEARPEQQPVAFTEECEITNMQATGLYLRGFPSNAQGRDIPLYTAAPAAQPVTVKLPEPDVYEVNGTRFYDRLKESDVIAALTAAGISIAEGE